MSCFDYVLQVDVELCLCCTNLLHANYNSKQWNYQCADTLLYDFRIRKFNTRG